MNRRTFLSQALKVIALSPLLVGGKAIEIIREPTIADKIRLQRPPPLEPPKEEPSSSPFRFAKTHSWQINFSGRDHDDAFEANLDVVDGILYLWQ